MAELLITAEDIIAARPRGSRGKEEDLIRKACAFAKEKHGDQMRYSGHPYYTHTFEVGRILAGMGMGATVIAAGILHDVIEDTDTTEKDLEKMFGKKIAFFVNGVSNLGDVRYRGLDTRVKSLQKLFVATSKDLRVILIKLIDRLHNMRTLDAVSKVKRKRIANETIRVYAPIAERLGMGDVRSELEELAFKHLEPDRYRSISEEVQAVTKSVSTQAMEKKLTRAIGKKSITCTITSRIKSAYSTYNKMKFKRYSIEQIQDLIAFRILVDDVQMAYRVLGIVHGEWRSIPRTFKDYISLPKPNGYQALHTTILIGQHVVEVQILTHDMQRQAQFGIAAHFTYKEKQRGVPGINLDWFKKLLPQSAVTGPAWVDQVSSMHGDGEEFLQNMESDFLKERIFVFTPKGDVVDLPKEATVADFAFAIHSDIGLRAEGGFVNGNYRSLRHELENGDVVLVKAGKRDRVTEKWLDWIKTAEARTKVRRATKKSS
ncbi:MAG: HD domain-containing protein [Candidatus Kaiserbacteria bacterium]|nr:HD domain-containing protein [Candidatus Kaiserbacteria bacterium]